MDLESILNIISLLTRIIGLISCLFYYIDRPQKGWLRLVSVYLLFLLSDYYWTVFTLVTGKNPDISAFMAYLGWNLGYLMMWITVRMMESQHEKKFFHPLMLLPIPFNIAQLLLYNTFGGVFNNIWQVVTSTGIMVECIRVLTYCYKNRKEQGIPHFHLCIFFYILCEYGMWTSSCFDWPSEWLHPYNYFAMISCFLVLSFAKTMQMSSGESHRSVYDKSSTELRDQMVLQLVFCVIVLGSCLGGYILAVWMRTKLVLSGMTSADEGVFNIIAIILFVVSVFQALLVLSVMIMVWMRQKQMERPARRDESQPKGRFNFFFILLVTFLLMVFAVVYTSSLFYRVSVSGNYEDCRDRVISTAAELENYVNSSSSVLWVIGNTVDDMIRNGSSGDEIEQYIINQTENQKKQFDENFTGVYGYIGGEFIDGLEWVPPEGYDATRRDWYRYAKEGDGKVVIVPPYIDAQTNEMVVTFCKMLSDNESVVALDVKVNHIQDVTGDINVFGKGYGMLVDDRGVIVAHHDKELVGKNVSELYGEEFYPCIVTTAENSGIYDLDGEEYHYFEKDVLDQWYLIIMVSKAELFEEIRTQMLVNIVVFMLIFMLMTMFYYLGYKNEQAYGKKMEEMSVSRQKQEYETRMLKLEKKAADEANRAKSDFLADMSHEIRTPINAILGMNEMILRESRENEIRSYSANIKSAGSNLLQLINTILDFSKIEDGKMEIVPVHYSTEAMITYLVNGVSERAKNKGLEFRTVIDPQLPSGLYGDDMRISQVIMNLLTNAVKYTPEGSVTLTMKAADRKGDRLLLYVQVSDTGIGIKQENLPHLFDSFERFDVNKNRYIEGTGLGMSIVTRLLEMMDSTLSVESIYGSGSVFSFEVDQIIKDDTPIGDISRRVSKLTSGRAGGDYKESFHAPSAHILVVDDITLNLTVITSLLKKTELKIDTASSGEEALKLTVTEKYDLILLDQRMPGMNGVQTLEAIRSQNEGKNRETPVICLTADAVNGAKERYISSGFSDYLIKPVDTYELERKLFRFLPEEKIEIYRGASEDNSVAEVSQDEDGFSILINSGLDVESALALLQGDKEVYRIIMAEYADESAEKIEAMDRYYSEKNWADYAILAHSLKSTSKNIGAMRLSELAEKMEKAADDNDETFITERHELMMKLYYGVVNIIRNQMDDKHCADSVGTKQEVFEFSPQDEA